MKNTLLLLLMLSASSLAVAQTNETPSTAWQMSGEAASTKNSDDAIVANIRSGQTANEFARVAGRSPIIWARYNPGNSIGIIVVTRTFKRPDGSTDLTLTPYRPAYGQRFASGGAGKTITYYGGVNPFGAFDGGDDYFRNINFSGFLAATGLVMRNINSSVGFVYHPALTPVGQGTLSGQEMQFNPSGSVTYSASGRWLMALAAETGDRRGFVPAYRVSGCNVAIDLRNNCVVKGFASFVPWNDGNLPATSFNLGNRTNAGSIDTSAMSSVFAGIENFVREGALWSASSWYAVGNNASVTASLGIQTSSIQRRDLLVDVAAAATGTLANTTTYGIATARTMNAWDLSDAATAEFIVKPLTAPGGGLGATAAAANWQSERDQKPVSDVLNKNGTTPTHRTVFGAQPQQ